MKPAVALAMLQREGRWLLQLRDDIDSIIYPGHWGLFGGHLEPGETASEAVHRELQEEIDWSPTEPLEPWFSDDSGNRVAHLFRGPLGVPLNQLQLKEGQEMKLVSLSDLLRESIWSERQQELRPVAPGLSIVIERLLKEAHDH
ncbi:NUDIX hydrolase [Synechococcus sp. KORDI-52]|uniref:NUDIX hydrolase n=1 Tax=Synechococcus sp. KORDI-52 TaxID=585425 RepID=UPI0004E08FE1|nr:NUDIX hydrolase [Synechococcus sp. KORDI-52]AII49262.1 NUDIX hydrolase [Synechococcus sp. KORDI-52]